MNEAHPFYLLLLETTLLRWHDITPRGYVFSIKANRYITHIELLDEWVRSSALSSFIVLLVFHSTAGGWMCYVKSLSRSSGMHSSFEIPAGFTGRPVIF